jgi:hypothetical protein
MLLFRIVLVVLLVIGRFCRRLVREDEDENKDE